MASISRTSKQIIVQEYWQGRRFNFSFRLDQEEEAEAQKAWLESEKRRAKQVGKPPTFSLADDAKRKQREAVDEAHKGRVKRPRTRTTPTKLLEDFARHKRPDWHGNTETTYIHAWDSFCRNVPFRTIEQLTLGDVQKYKDKPVSPKGQALSETTIHNNIKRIFAVLAFAQSHGLLVRGGQEVKRVAA